MKKCNHKKSRGQYCKTCHPELICKHGKMRHCRICNPREFCRHGKRCCRICSPIHWAQTRLSHAQRRAAIFGYAAPKINAKGIVELSKSTHCFGCETLLDWAKENPHLHHNHKSGHVYGFMHQNCNLLEGLLSRFNSKILIKLFKNFRLKGKIF